MGAVLLVVAMVEVLKLVVLVAELLR